VLFERVQRRKDDPSDADADVIRWQRAQPVGVVDWQRLDASSSVDTLLQEVTPVVCEVMSATQR
jgi:predicted kinase